MVGSSGGSATGNAEKRARNPMEILPHSAPNRPTISFESDTAEIALPAHLMLVRWIVVTGTVDGIETHRTVDFYSIVDQGTTERNGQLQQGLFIEASAPLDSQGNPTRINGTYLLKIRPAPADGAAMRVTSVHLFDDKGNVLGDAQRP
jgi:hypothetical protein